MMLDKRFAGALALSALSLSAAVPAQAEQTKSKKCLRFNKTTGAIAGGAGGALLGKVILGGTTGLVVGAAAGGIAGHSLAKNGKKRCK